MTWKLDDRLVHRFNPDLGPGKIVETAGRAVVVAFPLRGEILRLAADSDALVPLRFVPGMRVRVEATGRVGLLSALFQDGTCRLDDGSILSIDALWPLDVGDSPVDRLAQGEVDSVETFSLRLEALHLAGVREADGLGSFLGGRIRLFPHQFHTAERATRTDPVRWLLADEVGLGKTVEACLILNHLIRARRTERTLVVAPETLVVQWLGELWRKYHQVFVLLDDKRLADVERDLGPGFNPFDVHRRAVVSLEALTARPRLTEQAVEAGIDLLIVDEAHRLRRPPGHPGEPPYRAIAPIAALGRHLLLLSATPLEDDAHGFFRLLQLLRPEQFPEDASFEERLSRREPLPPCTSSTRRVDIGGLPPRAGVPVDLDDDEGIADLLALEEAIRSRPAAHAVARREKTERIARALSSGAALEAVVPRDDEALRKAARRAALHDPRTAWLQEAVRAWRERGDRTLVFVAYRETLHLLKAALERTVGRVGVFHEDLSTAQRDIEVAQFRAEGGPSVLISTECGGEGRNFEFCTRVVLFDLPRSPAVLEQRIGRLDRIGRTIPVEIVYFRPGRGVGAALAALHERIGIFREPLGGLERELAHVEEALDEAILDGVGPIPLERFDPVVREAREAADRVRQAAYHELHRDRYLPAAADAILARIPADLDERTEEIVLAACEALGFHVESHRDGATHSIEFGNRARVDSLPGVPGGASFLGSFRREEAIEDESIDYFATGHPLVEGILAEIEDGPLGRTAVLHLEAGGDRGFGLVAIYKNGPLFEAIAVDLDGTPRPAWAAAVRRRPLRTRRVKPEALTSQPGWAQMIRRMAAATGRPERPVAVAAVLVG